MDLTVAKNETQRWLEVCRERLSVFPGALRCLEDVLVQHRSATVTLDLARIAAFMWIEKMTGVAPHDQVKDRSLTDGRFVLQSTLSFYGGFLFTQQVFAMDPDISVELTKNTRDHYSDVDGKPLPVDALDRVPFNNFVIVPNLPCSYQSVMVSRAGLQGDTTLLEMCALGDGGVHEFAIPLSPGRNIPQLIDEFFAEASTYAHSAGVSLPPHVSRTNAESLVRSVLPLVLYLCAGNKEVEGGISPPLAPKKTRKGERIFLPDKPFMAEVGVRIGSALRNHRRLESAETSTGQPGLGTKAPHLRGSHWHTYWEGSRKEEDQRKQVLHFLSPIPVKMKPGQAPYPTVRPVR